MSGLAYGFGCFWPETASGITLSLLGVIGWVWLYRKTNLPYLYLFLSGATFYLTAFYWIPQSLISFNIAYAKSTDLFMTYTAFFGFSLLSSLQFGFVGFLAKALDRTKLGNLLLSFPLAWLVCEFLFPRLFPWALVHPFISWSWLSSFADIAGVYLPGAILLLLICCVFEVAQLKLKSVMGIVAIFIVLSVYSISRERKIEFEIKSSNLVRVALVQANLSGVRDSATDPFGRRGLEVYRELTKRFEGKSQADFIIWPEAASWLPTLSDAENVFLPAWQPVESISVPLVFGNVSLHDNGADQKPRYTRQNSVISIDKDGNVVGRYFKRKLMPFGERIPFEGYFPWLSNLSRQTSEVLAGSLSQDPITVSGNNAKLAVSICYEDINADLNKQLVSKGANILLTVANNAWYGDSPAYRQHHLLSSWRAIESRRYQLKVNNTGLTAVVDPFGKTIQELQPFSEGVLEASVPLLKQKALYLWAGDYLNWLLVIITLGYLLSKFSIQDFKNKIPLIR